MSFHKYICFIFLIGCASNSAQNFVLTPYPLTIKHITDQANPIEEDIEIISSHACNYINELIDPLCLAMMKDLCKPLLAGVIAAWLYSILTR